jgi:CBS domain-containing protein
MEDNMKVEEIMTPNVQPCRPGNSLAEAVTLMWDCDCGSLPVVNSSDEVIGVITDRDIAIAVATRARPAGDISVGEVISGIAFVCEKEEDVKSALKTMRREKVHRLPVVGEGGKLAGILSLNDIVLRAEENGKRQAPEISYEDVVSTLKAIGEHTNLQYSSVGIA